MTSKIFIAKKVKDFSAGGLKTFPGDFIISCDFIPFQLPSGTLIMGNEFFGCYEILTATRVPFCQAESLAKAKYIVYTARGKNEEIKIPVNEKDIEAVVKEYEKYLDDILRQIKKEYLLQFPEGKEANIVVNKIFGLLNLSRL
ncbi:MAG TPA: hypothetical protein VLB50_07785 [Ignavibacteriaceae bacterium]|nr:hypothetical protein [Ignavibacteriaceae bacterium]